MSRASRINARARARVHSSTGSLTTSISRSTPGRAGGRPSRRARRRRRRRTGDGRRAGCSFGHAPIKFTHNSTSARPVISATCVNPAACDRCPCPCLHGRLALSDYRRLAGTRPIPAATCPMQCVHTATAACFRRYSLSRSCRGVARSDGREVSRIDRMAAERSALDRRPPV